MWWRIWQQNPTLSDYLNLPEHVRLNWQIFNSLEAWITNETPTQQELKAQGVATLDYTADGDADDFEELSE